MEQAHKHHGNNEMNSKNGTIKKDNDKRTFKLAVNATLHCLLGCGLGEVAGMAIATVLKMEMMNAMITAIVLGFIAGMLLGIIPLLKAGFNFNQAFQTVIAAEGLSIIVMEAFEIMTQVFIPGVMEAQLNELIFWLGMMAGLTVGFIAALPVNYVMIKKGVRHLH